MELDLTQLALSRLDEARSRALIDRRAGTREELEKSEATRRKNEAQIKADRANLEQAKADYATGILVAKSMLGAAKAEVRNAEIDLGYCRVTAPIDGRTSRSELDVGNYVGDGQATVLATIVKTDPIRAYINVSEDDLPRIQRMVRQGEEAGIARKAPLPMEMGLGDEEGYPHLGHADYTDPVVDQGTGTVRIRGVFPNPGSVIAPGQFVRVRLPIERREDALLVPSRALGFDQAGEYLLVVGKDNLVERRSVKAGTEVDGMRVVDGKIGPADRVVVDGLLRARPGLKVDPKLEEDKTQAIAAAHSPTGNRAPTLEIDWTRFMFSRFFIERPIFANVIAIVTMLVGGVTLFTLPIEQYPEITPPTVQVTTSYPGANAQVLADTVASPLEQEINGVQDMLYMSSTSASDGSYTLTITFEVGTDLDRAQVLVQNRVAIAQPKLPLEVQRQGITAKKQSTNFIMAVALTSPDNRYDGLYLSNFATQKVKDVLSRIAGVGDVQVFGSGNYGMRIWINPEKLKARSLTTQDVVNAIAEQNVQVAAGQVGQSPSPIDQSFQYNITTLGRLSDPEEFGNIIVKTVEDDPSRMRLTRVKDVARVELGAQVYDQWCEIGGKAAAGVGVFQLPGANALEVARNVQQAMERLKTSFPEGVVYSIPFNPTEFVDESIHEVYKTLFEAGVLVLVVIMVFLQDWRAVLIPATTVPVTIIGAFAAMKALGFTINMLTLFGLVLAIGIVVDDAIVIVENAVHHIDRGATGPQECDHQGDVRGHWTGHRHYPGADGRVPADGLPPRDHRPALPPVRPDDRRDRLDQRDQRRDAQARAMRHVFAPDTRAAESVLPRVQRRVRPLRGGLRCLWSVARSGRRS